jgi:hypothetical protein
LCLCGDNYFGVGVGVFVPGLGVRVGVFGWGVDVAVGVFVMVGVSEGVFSAARC